MKKSITKLFKLDEPLGRRDFSKIAFLIFLLWVNMIYIEKYFFNKSSPWVLFVFTAFITPFAVRRLKDINANEFLAGLFILQMIFFEIFLYRFAFCGGDLFYPFARFSVLFIIFFPAIVLILFLSLVLIKGQKVDDLKAKRPKIIRKNTLIINMIILSYILVVFGVYQYEVYSTKKNAMIIVEALDKFKVEKGYYPKKIKKISPRFVEEIPETEGIFFTRGSFEYWGSGNCGGEHEFWIRFMILTGSFPIYSSDKRVWTE